MEDSFMDDADLQGVKRAFYDVNKFPPFSQLAKQYAVIVQELKNNDFWMTWGSDAYDPSGHCKFLEGDWTVCPVYFGNINPRMLVVPGMDGLAIGELAKSLPAKFPATTKLLKDINSINFAAFSRLHPKSRLAPHAHKNPFSLIFHLGLIIPQGNSCGISVDNEVHLWKNPGDAIIFDDTLQHSAWNDSEEERIILYIDFLKN